MGLLRTSAAGLGLSALGLVGGFLAGLLRRRTPSHYVGDRHAPRAH